ncbi:MAG: tRNA epoxyqueuosine(34) reductase QueG [Chloroflexota bacterium]|nr:tRNA epoxyqueuosine(34) reductase QueG [Dehalococcoidia bacterium]MDW8253040.1 tRNA epoxyqueuosine(34) reductase QueG [Chloroflexota bacterium]
MLPSRERAPLDPDAIARALEADAAALGFDLFGIAPADTLVEDLAAYRQRLAEGRLRGMDWLNDERVIAFAPTQLVEEACSVIVLGMSYYIPAAPEPAADDHGPTGRVARYARGRDYHRVIRPKLRRLAGRLAELAGRPVRARLFVDSGPLAERAFARAAGIGWIGKNTLLLNRRLGSWSFLAAIVSDVALPTGKPVRTNCGACDRCLRACPTEAFVAPYVLDATRCISYLTIEHRGPIPPELRPAMGDWIFGCDVCQDVCPVNRKAAAAREPDFAPRPGIGERTALLPLLALDDAAFDARFRGSAIRRAKREGFLRNVAIALGNSGDPAAVPALAAALRNDPSPVVRGAAAWALGRIGGEAARRALAAADDPDPTVQEEIAAALARIAPAAPGSKSAAAGRSSLPVTRPQNGQASERGQATDQLASSVSLPG